MTSPNSDARIPAILARGGLGTEVPHLATFDNFPGYWITLTLFSLFTLRRSGFLVVGRATGWRLTARYLIVR